MKGFGDFGKGWWSRVENSSFEQFPFGQESEISCPLCEVICEFLCLEAQRNTLISFHCWADWTMVAFSAIELTKVFSILCFTEEQSRVHFFAYVYCFFFFFCLLLLKYLGTQNGPDRGTLVIPLFYGWGNRSLETYVSRGRPESRNLSATSYLGFVVHRIHPLLPKCSQVKKMRSMIPNSLK